MDEAFEIGFAAARINGIAVKIKFHDVFGLDLARRDAARKQKAVGARGVTHADVAKAIHHAFVVQNVIGGDEVVDEVFYSGVFSHGVSIVKKYRFAWPLQMHIPLQAAIRYLGSNQRRAPRSRYQIQHRISRICRLVRKVNPRHQLL